VPASAEELLEQARSRIQRLSPAAAWAALQAGDAVIVDIRSDAARGRDGVVPGSVHVPRTVMEWRLDPQSPWRNPHVTDGRRRIVVLCDHGWGSSLAAATLVELGYADAADVDGGFEAWCAEGLPVRVVSPPAVEAVLPGMASPEPL
jgi:rhodanese-related sulfurtransferase